MCVSVGYCVLVVCREEQYLINDTINAACGDFGCISLIVFDLRNCLRMPFNRQCEPTLIILSINNLDTL